MNRSWIRRLTLFGACAAPLTAAGLALAQTPSKVEDPARDNAPATSDATRNRDNAAERQDASQSQAERGQREQRDQESHAPAGQKIDDRTLAAILLIGNQKEVAVSRLAASRAQNPEVKQFAQEMSQAHGQFISKLAQLAGARERTTDGPGNPFAPQRDPAGRAASKAANETAAADQARSAERSGVQTGRNDARPRGDWQRYDLGASPLVSFDRELAEQCLQTTERFLGQQQGAEFDRWFMALQLVEHMGMRDRLQVARRHATGELRGLVDQGIQTTDEHIRQAEQVMRQLPHAGVAAQTSNRPAATRAQ